MRFPLVIPDFLTPTACASFRAAMDRGAASPAMIASSDFQIDERVRRTSEVDVDAEAVERADRVVLSALPRIAAHFATPLVDHEGAGFLRYLIGGFYRVHADVTPEWSADFPRLISIVLFLTTSGAAAVNDCAGGTLRLYPAERGGFAGDAIDITPAAGTLVAFPATMLHEVLPVTFGVRDVIVDWMY